MVTACVPTNGNGHMNCRTIGAVPASTRLAVTLHTPAVSTASVIARRVRAVPRDCGRTALPCALFIVDRVLRFFLAMSSVRPGSKEPATPGVN